MVDWVGEGRGWLVRLAELSVRLESFWASLCITDVLRSRIVRFHVKINLMLDFQRLGFQVDTILFLNFRISHIVTFELRISKFWVSERFDIDY